MPNGSWDSHLHVLDPVRFPPIPGSYEFGTYTAWDSTIEEIRLGWSHMVLIQPSVYGNDNTLLIDTLKAFGLDRAHGVVVFDVANTSAAQLREWNNLGIYIAMKDIHDIEPVIPTLGVNVVIDHLGHPDIPKSNTSGTALDPYSLSGFDSMLRLLEGGNTWVKVSAVYRLSKAPGPLYTDLDPVILELFKTAPSRLVYASDWPHTRFEGLDIKPWTSHLLDLTKGNVELRNQLFRDNAQELWGGNDTIASSAKS
ncbi:hypothetical protein FGADI_7071 [Fusarium gaditjirri]|uniref:Amidohydrolase-related domain-containing protein n=1 Tax=Fusarium gaditjirri TaxID=282569 RepID=A0A8H4T5W6_9HYPO|nr:hypothetical protein FGADI_7071 [Fusarium gaditjirri]